MFIYFNSKPKSSVLDLDSPRAQKSIQNEKKMCCYFIENGLDPLFWSKYVLKWYLMGKYIKNFSYARSSFVIEGLYSSAKGLSDLRHFLKMIQMMKHRTPRSPKIPSAMRMFCPWLILDGPYDSVVLVSGIVIYTSVVLSASHLYRTVVDYHSTCPIDKSFCNPCFVFLKLR